MVIVAEVQPITGVGVGVGPPGVGVGAIGVGVGAPGVGVGPAGVAVAAGVGVGVGPPWSLKAGTQISCSFFTSKYRRPKLIVSTPASRLSNFGCFGSVLESFA